MLVELENVGKVYARGRRLIVALDAVCLGVARGDCLAVYGSGRSGKSTLLRLVAGAEAPTAGSIHYDGQDLRALKERERARRLRSEVSLVPTTLDFYAGMSVLDQVALPVFLCSRDHDGARRRARWALSIAGVAYCADAQPGELSDGELRLAAVAQALAKRPRLLLADEPATNLDPVERDAVLDLLRSCAVEEGAAVLFTATHADETLRSTSLVRLDAGRLIVPSAPEPRGEVVALADRQVRRGRMDA
jgi:ABC-type lipoprotein export system ATPase subunit